jgi:hypothetical protein
MASSRGELSCWQCHCHHSRAVTSAEKHMPTKRCMIIPYVVGLSFLLNVPMFCALCNYFCRSFLAIPNQSWSCFPLASLHNSYGRNAREVLRILFDEDEPSLNAISCVISLLLLLWLPDSFFTRLVLIHSYLLHIASCKSFA